MKQLFIRGVYAIFEYRLREIRLFGFLWWFPHGLFMP
jgi:hypothetical protein